MCYQCSQLISAYIDGELNSSDQQKVQEHLLQCNSCQELYSGFLALGDEFRQEISKVPCSPDLELRIMHELKMEKIRTVQQMWLTSLILALLLSPFLILFSPIIKTLVHLGYVAVTALWRTVPALLQTVIPVSPLALGIMATLLTIIGVYLIRTLLRGIHFNEVFS